MKQYKIKATFKDGTIKYISHDLFEEVMGGDGRRPMVDDIEKATDFGAVSAKDFLKKYYDNYGLRKTDIVLEIIVLEII